MSPPSFQKSGEFKPKEIEKTLPRPPMENDAKSKTDSTNKKKEKNDPQDEGKQPDAFAAVFERFFQ